jgi:hypothetical protein
LDSLFCQSRDLEIEIKERLAKISLWKIGVDFLLLKYLNHV